MASKGGRSAEKIVEDNFTRAGKKDNKSNRHYWKCNHCDAPEIEGRDQRPVRHLSDPTQCTGAPPDVRQAAHLHLMHKGGTSSGPLLPNAVAPGEAASSTASPGDTQAVKKRKRNAGTLDGYVDHALTTAQREDADLKFFRFVVHSNSAFRIANNPYLHAWIQSIRPSYEVPSRYVLSGRLLLAENSRVHIEEVERLKGRKRVTILLDGWEDALRRSLYGSVAAGVGEYPSLLALQDLTGNRGSADKYLETVTNALDKMEIGDAKNVIALTTDNPTVMQSFRRKFQAKFPWVLIFACFLHGLNTIIGKIVSHPGMKKFISATATIVSFFNGSHYWGGQLEQEAKAAKVGRSLKTRTESRWYSLILQALSVVAHRAPLLRVCSRPDARKKTNGFTPVSAAVINWVLNAEYWNRLDQLIRICKPLVDAIGNLEARDVNLADCMLELLRCARHVTTLEFQPDDDLTFLDHARETFLHEFHAMDTDIHALALFLHPRCRKIAVSQVAKSRSFEDMCKTALAIAQSWGWDSARSSLLVDDLQLYHACKGVFVGSSDNAKEWWENLPISGDRNPLKTLAIVLFSVVPHAAEVERLFSGLSGIQGVKRCNLSVPTFEILGKLRNNYAYYIYLQDRANGVAVHRKHGHMHTRQAPGIDSDLADEVEVNFSWRPPLVVENITDDIDTGGIQELTAEEVDAAFANWDADLEAERQQRAALPMNKHPVDIPLVYDLTELERVDQGAAPTAFDDDVTIHTDVAPDRWDISTLLAAKGVSSR